MANALVIGLMISIFSIEWLVRERGLLNTYFILVPEVLSAIAMLIVLARLMSGRQVALDSRYVMFLGILLFTILFAFLVQDVPAGAMVAGIRSHLKFIPFFLLPAVYRFTPGQLKAQLMVAFAMLLLQTPLAFYQRYVEYVGIMESGDPVRGTATTSSALSMLLIGGIIGVVVAYLRRRLTFVQALPLLAWLFVPTTINETKATLFLLPIAVVVPALLMRRSEKPLRRLVPILGVAAVGLVAFVVVYNSFIKYREYPMTIEEFFSSGYVERYLASGGADAGANYIGRFDSMQYAAEHIASDPLKLAFGYGAGNVSTSFLDEFEGRYVHYYDRYGVGMTQVSHFLWEIGVVGLAAYLLLYWFLFSDARLLARSSTPFAAFGQLWATVMLIMGFALIYKSIFAMNEIGYVFWYYGGVVASEAVLLRRARHATAQAARQMPAAWRAATGNALLEHRNLGLKGS